MRLVVLLHNRGTPVDLPDETVRIAYEVPFGSVDSESTLLARLAYELGARWGDPARTGVHVKSAHVEYPE